MVDVAYLILAGALAVSLTCVVAAPTLSPVGFGQVADGNRPSYVDPAVVAGRQAGDV